MENTSSAGAMMGDDLYGYDMLVFPRVDWALGWHGEWEVNWRHGVYMRVRRSGVTTTVVWPTCVVDYA